MRPYDPAGTRPKHRPEDLVPRRREDVVDGDAVEEALPALGAGGEAGGDGPGDAAAGDAARPGELVPAGAAPGGGLGAPSPAAARAVPRARFRLVLAALLAIAGAGMAGAVLLVTGDDEPARRAGPAWSAWQPTGSESERVASIAARVGKEYRGEDGQLVAVTAGPLEVAGLPLTVAVRRSAEEGGDIELQPGGGVLYRLCGLGEQCSIPSGKPSAERLLLLRREALELALYTFSYTAQDKVVVFLPPAKGQSPTQAQYFRRANLAPQLAKPLTASLAPEAPTVAGMTASPDAPLVEGVTAPSLFKFSLTQANTDSGAFLVLAPIRSTT